MTEKLEHTTSRSINALAEADLHPPALRRWQDWAGKGTLAIIDQALLSGSNFALSIFLARSLSEEEYGAYAVTFAIFILLGTLYQALLLVPSLIIGPTLYKQQRRGYLGALVRLHVVTTLLSGVGLGLTALVIFRISPDSYLAGSFAGLALALPCVLLFWLARSAWYLDLAPGPAAAGALVYSVLLLSGAALLHYFALVSAFTGFIVMMVAGLMLSIILLARLRPIVWSSQGRVSTREVWRESWVYGRWELAIALAVWLPGNLCYPLTAGILGIGEAGALRAMHNLALPIGQALGAVLRLAQPYMSARFGEQGHAATARPVQRLALMAMSGTGLYLMLVSFMREPLMQAFYGGKFANAVVLVPWMLLATVFSAGAEGLGVGLRAMRSSASLFVAYLGASVVYLLIGVPAARVFGLSGVVGTLVVVNAVALITIAVLFQRKGADQTRAFGSAQA